MTTWLTTVAVMAAIALVAAGLAPTPRPRVPGSAAAPAHPIDAATRWARVPRQAPSLRWRRRRPVGPVAVAEWCDGIARSIRAGDTARSAIAMLPDDRDVARATSSFRSRLERGAALADAAVDLDGIAEEPHLAMAVSVIGATSRLGEVRADPYDRVAAALRMRDADRQERAVHSAQAAMSARVLTALPVAMLALLVATDGGVRSALAEPLGATLVAIGALFNAAGWLWMRKIVRSS